MRCLLCNKCHCPHTNALDDGEGRPESRMGTENFLTALAIATGTTKYTLRGFASAPGRGRE